jgi:hypothetical protein
VKSPSKTKGLGSFEPSLNVAANLKNRSASPEPATPENDKPTYAPKSINLRETDWRLLRLVARARADRNGGRDSVSKVVESLIDAARKDLQKEIG